MANQIKHASDCAVNAPAYPAGECTCGAVPAAPKRGPYQAVDTENEDHEFCYEIIGPHRAGKWKSSAIAEQIAREHDASYLAGQRSVAGALQKTLETASLLLQNSEVCVVNHYAENFLQRHGMPGWLRDCASQLTNARALLASLDAEEGK